MRITARSATMSGCASEFKNSEQVTLLGRTSGGGSCVVMPMSTAYGSLFRISGPNRLAFTKNGSFYDIDQGAEPDFTLAFPETLYDREALTDYINNLHWPKSKQRGRFHTTGTAPDFS